ncbi:hypothetical protein C8034_v009411 [Colletotrichum sidae]|uniref:Ribosomal protein/NADH dehydrogenase domain-containing protein n=1 Tax=Colletotrichum sidae TaxID=1347389 RepID=A0A4R8TME7_9PEZI|nr:hypothetical protein C8034_v009411 [Colletotrichum sidae]
MVRVGKRWHALRAIFSLRFGPGAAVLPPNVTRIHMEFAKTMNDGHMGPRRFWRDILPRLKYYNPATPMIVNRKQTNEGAAVMSIYLNNNPDETPIDTSSLPQPPSSAVDASKAPNPIKGEKVIKFDMKDKRSEEILVRFMAETEAAQQYPTPEEEAELVEVEELKVIGQKDREIVAKRINAAKREKAMLDRARAEVAS